MFNQIDLPLLVWLILVFGTIPVFLTVLICAINYITFNKLFNKITLNLMLETMFKETNPLILFYLIGCTFYFMTISVSIKNIIFVLFLFTPFPRFSYDIGKLWGEFIRHCKILLNSNKKIN